MLYACTHHDYDQIFAPVAPTPGATFVLFSDRKPRFARGWEWRPLPPETAGMSQTMVNRYAKFFSHKLFPEVEISIYVDANILILADLTPLVAEFVASGAEIGLFPHMQRGDIFEEFEFAAQVGKIPPADLAKGRAQLARYVAAGLPSDHRLTENAIIFRRHDGRGLTDAMDMWWQEMEDGTRRDQISLPWVRHATGLSSWLWDWNYNFDNLYFHRYLHRRGLLSDLNVFVKNKQHYGAFNRRFYGAIQLVSHGLFKRRGPGTDT